MSLVCLQVLTGLRAACSETASAQETWTSLLLHSTCSVRALTLSLIFQISRTLPTATWNTPRWKSIRALLTQAVWLIRLFLAVIRTQLQKVSQPAQKCLKMQSGMFRIFLSIRMTSAESTRALSESTLRAERAVQALFWSTTTATQFQRQCSLQSATLSRQRAMPHSVSFSRKKSSNFSRSSGSAKNDRSKCLTLPQLSLKVMMKASMSQLVA